MWWLENLGHLSIGFYGLVRVEYVMFLCFHMHCFLIACRIFCYVRGSYFALFLWEVVSVAGKESCILSLTHTRNIWLDETSAVGSSRIFCPVLWAATFSQQDFNKISASRIGKILIFDYFLFSYLFTFGILILFLYLRCRPFLSVCLLTFGAFGCIKFTVWI